MPLSISGLDVVQQSGPRQAGVAGEAITAGQLLYQKSEDLKFYKAQADGTAEEATVAGISLNGAGTGQPIYYAETGVVRLGSGFDAGQVIVAGATAGSLYTASELAEGDLVTVVGIMDAADLTINLIVSGVAYEAP